MATELTNDERQLLRLIRQLMVALAKTVSDIRPQLLEKYQLGEQRTNLAIAAALTLNACFSCKIAAHLDFDDCDDVDAKILELIRQTTK